ncbi:MAG: hypothetical protein J6Y29_06530 [Clostridiales bacterium]|nr:hypothetical protein [Clostridiales bacterium]
MRQALKILDMEIEKARSINISCIKVVHGYGSTGVGGKIKARLDAVLPKKKKDGQIKDFIPGKDWSIFNEKTRHVLDKVSGARNDEDLDKFNIGITVIVL